MDTKGRALVRIFSPIKQFDTGFDTAFSVITQLRAPLAVTPTSAAWPT